MSENKLPVYIAQMLDAAATACNYVESYDKEDFLGDQRTQQAVMLNILIIGEVATKVAQNYPEFAAAHQQVPWNSMRNMRNRIAHGYFEIDFEVVWETVSISLPPVLSALQAIDID